MKQRGAECVCVCFSLVNHTQGSMRISLPRSPRSLKCSPTGRGWDLSPISLSFAAQYHKWRSFCIALIIIDVVGAPVIMLTLLLLNRKKLIGMHIHTHALTQRKEHREIV